MTDPITAMLEEASRRDQMLRTFTVSKEMLRDIERLTCTCTERKLRELGWPRHATTHAPSCPLSTDTP